MATAELEYDSFFDYNHMKIRVKEGERAVAELSVLPEHLDQYQRIHSGALYTLCDAASGYAAHGDGRIYVTQSSSFNVMKNTSKGTLIRAVAYVKHRGETTAIVDTTITDDLGCVLALGRYTFYCITAEQKIELV